MSSMSSTFTESESLGTSDSYHEMNKKSMDPHPFYPTLGSPMVYFAQVPTGRISKRHHERKPSLFVRAFRWYTEEHRPPRKIPPFFIEQEHEMDTRHATSSCRDTICEKNEMSAFAHWLDIKYAQFLLERPENGNICCEKRTQPSTVDCEHVAYRHQCNPCYPGEVKKRFSKFTRCRRRQSKSADRAYCKTNVQPEGILSISMEYIMAPRSDSPVNSECCQATPTTTSNPSANKGLAKSHSVTNCKMDDELLSPKIDKPPMEERSYIIKPALDLESNIVEPTVIEKVIKVQKETKPKKLMRLKQNISCQCYVHPPSENVETQYSENFQPSSNTDSQGLANSKQEGKDKCDCKVEEIHKIPSKSDASSQFVTELKLEAQSQYQEPPESPPLADKVGLQPIAQTKLTRWQVIASGKQEGNQELQSKVQSGNICPSIHGSSFNKPLPEPTCPVPCSDLNQQCLNLGSCKHVSRQVSSCTKLRQLSTCQRTGHKNSDAESHQNPVAFKVSHVQSKEQQGPPLKLLSATAEPEQRPPIKLSCVQTEPRKEPRLDLACSQESPSKLKQVTNSNLNPVLLKPRPSFYKPASALVTPCSSLQQPGPERKGRTFEESCCAPLIYKSDYEATTSKDNLMEQNTTSTGSTATQIKSPSYKEYQNSKRVHQFGSSKTHYEMNHTCVCGKTIPIRETVCLLCDCGQCSCVKYEETFNTREQSENVKKLSVAQQTSVTGKCCTERPIFSDLKNGFGSRVTQSVDTKPRYNIGSQTSDHSIRFDDETESQNYPLFMKIVRADKLQ